MKRAVFYGNEVIKVEESPEPKLRKGWAKMKVAYCAVCGSELSLFKMPRFTQSLPHGVVGEIGPFAMGHECAGIITEVGEGVTGVKKGDRVAVQPILGCGECYHCKKGLENLCDNGYGLLGSVIDGGMGEFICLPERNFLAIPDDMTLEAASLVQCGAVSFGSVIQSGITMGSTALVIGVGTIGLMTVQACITAGASKIFACDLMQHKLDYAKELGANRVVNVSEENIREVIALEAKGRGVDFVYECAGAPSTIADAIACVKKEGTVMLESVFYDKIPLQGIPFLQRQAKLMTCVSPFVHNYDFMIDLAYRGKMTSDKLITKRTNLEGISDAIKAMSTEEKQMKIMVEVDTSLGK